jgi:hypothetical protein
VFFIAVAYLLDRIGNAPVKWKEMRQLSRWNCCCYCLSRASDLARGPIQQTHQKGCSCAHAPLPQLLVVASPAGVAEAAICLLLLLLVLALLLALLVLLLLLALLLPLMFRLEQKALGDQLNQTSLLLKLGLLNGCSSWSGWAQGRLCGRHNRQRDCCSILTRSLAKVLPRKVAEMLWNSLRAQRQLLLLL